MKKRKERRRGKIEEVKKERETENDRDAGEEREEGRRGSCSEYKGDRRKKSAERNGSRTLDSKRGRTVSRGGKCRR